MKLLHLKRDAKQLRKSQFPKLALTVVILVCSGCYNKIPQVGGLIDHRNLLLTVLEIGKSGIMTSAWSDGGGRGGTAFW